ncbi:multicopper oxidase family protein [Kitasatospora viridis]|uniref:FtsP/CotA-like multicopper oxidase with cupredoxin domain n=1 Tax=Kitasatospora viridis TaxID=281105 RepID=A0A561UNS3_9ACTN|nr:multicopper oxidase family protein [Kitasatospora viridis]TWG01013.1 FtsP/CotA-like multicopper oxidase with cupredoxin domain [Kitasatospora viridis]
MSGDITDRSTPDRSHIRRTRRTFHAMAAVALLISAAVGTEAMAASPADTPQPPSTAQQEKGMHAGRPFQDPADANSAVGAHPNLTITLDAKQTRFDVSGKQVFGESYTGSLVAPTIHVQPGQTLTIHLVNHLPTATNLHFHGLHVSPDGQSDDPFLCVAPGGSTTYQLALPADHPQGTYWYHSHAMSTACPAPGSTAMADLAAMDDAGMTGDVENQIFAGLSGALVVGDDRTLLPADLRHITTHTIALKDVQLDASGHIPQNTATTSINSNNPTVRLVNGQLRPVLTMKPNETQLWRLANIGADIFYQLHLDGYCFTVINEDGTPVARTRDTDTLLLPPGKRYDVLVTASGKPGTATLRTTAYSNGPQGDSYPDTALATVKVAGHQVPRLPGVSGPMPTAPADLSTAPIAQRRTLDLSENADGTTFYINGKPFSMDSSVFQTPAKLGTVEEWTLVNESGEDHPFHLHTTAFQVTSINGVAQPYTNRQDIIPVPHAVNGVPGKVVIRVAFADYPGRWMFHCHIAAHEDNGMMSFINVVR